MPTDHLLAEELLLGMLRPVWQLVIGGFVLVAVVAAVYRLAQRGPSRMSLALLLSGGAVVCLTVLGMLFQDL